MVLPTIRETEMFQKPATVQIGYFLILAVYSTGGALLIAFLESSATPTYQKPKLTEQAKNCLKNLMIYKPNLVPDMDTLETIQCCFKEKVEYDWTFPSALLFTFTLITTIGYGHVYPVTTAGRIFCVFYGLCGIPLALIFLANIGKYIKTVITDLGLKIRQWRRTANRRYSVIPRDSKSRTSERSMRTIFLIIFMSYVLIGALILPLYEKEIDFMEAFYFIFVSLTTVGFGDIYPKSKEFFLISLIYIAIGLALNTITIDIMGQYLKQVHYFGRKLTDVAKTHVWFGGKRATVQGILQSFAEKRGVAPPDEDELMVLVEVAVELDKLPEELEELFFQDEVSPEEASSLPDTDDKSCSKSASVVSIHEINTPSPILEVKVEPVEESPPEPETSIKEPVEDELETPEPENTIPSEEPISENDDECGSGYLFIDRDNETAEVISFPASDVDRELTLELPPEPYPSQSSLNESQPDLKKEIGPSDSSSSEIGKSVVGSVFDFAMQNFYVQ